MKDDKTNYDTPKYFSGQLLEGIGGILDGLGDAIVLFVVGLFVVIMLVAAAFQFGGLALGFPVVVCLIGLLIWAVGRA